MAGKTSRVTTWQLRTVSPFGEEWRRLLASTPHLLFHEPVWARVTEEGFGAASHALMLERDGVPVGGMLGFVLRLPWAKVLHLSYPYGGVVGQAPEGRELARLLGELSRAEGLARVRLTSFPGLGAEPETGFRPIRLQTHVLEIAGRTPEEIWKGYKKRIRRDVRRAERSGVTVDEAGTPESAGEMFALYLASMRRQRAVPKYRRALVAAIREHVVARGRGELLLARCGGRAVAGIVVVDSVHCRHYLMGGSRTEALGSCPNELLVAGAIDRAAEKRLDGFDFLPSGENAESVERFKAKWGARPLPATVYDLVTRPVAMRLWNTASKVAASGPARLLLGRLRAREGRAR